MKNKAVRKKKAVPNTSELKNQALAKKDFIEDPTVEKLYKTIHNYKLREEAYKTTIETYLNHSK